MALLNFGKAKPVSGPSAAVAPLLQGVSIEVMPRTAAKIEDFRPLLPAASRIYIAHIDGTDFEEMLATAKRLGDEGFVVMPHIPARSIPDETTFRTWLKRYADEAGVQEALVLAGGAPEQRGPYASSMDLLETGLFDTFGFERLHVAGHPEGCRDIDPNGGTRLVDDALRWKQGFTDRTDADMALVTQFVFDAKPLLAWSERLAREGITLPIYAGVAGPTKLQTLLKFAVACGVGPSLKVLQKRAADITKLMVPFEPTDVLEQLAAGLVDSPANIAGIHVFPLGGIRNSADYIERHCSSIQA